MRTRSSALALALLCAACPASSMYRTADTVPPGRWQIAGGAGLGGFRDTQQDTRLATGELEAVVRRGVADDVDVGVRLFVPGIEAQVGWRFARGTWTWAVAPAIAIARTRDSALIPEALFVFARAPVIATRALSPTWSLSLGPDLGWGFYQPVTGGHAQGVWLGGFATAQWRFGERWWLAPELRVEVSHEIPVTGGALHLGCGVGVDL